MDPKTSERQLRIRYFASARDAAGCDAEVVPFVPGESIGALRQRIVALHPGLTRLLPYARFARNDAFAVDGDVLLGGDEVLVLPAASGGSGRAQLVDRPIVPGEAEALLTLDGAGGIATFVGVVRRENRGKSVQSLDFSAYPPLALHELEAICQEAIDQFGLVDARVLHRVGHLTLGEVAVAIGVAAPHRREAFDACSYVIDQLKKRAPIWKKETTDDGAEWIDATP
jgi:molybdopterin synthase catalytic subunit/molybdopterin converting factor small subunit